MTKMPTDTSPAPGPAQNRSFGRKIRWMGVFLVALVFLVVAGWFTGAHFYRQAIEEGRAILARDGIILTCSDETLTGFPARFEWRCSSLAIAFPTGAQISGGQIVTVAPVWNPLFTIAEWTGPFATLTGDSDRDGVDAQISASLLRASVRLNTRLELVRLSAVLDPFGVTLQGAPQPIVTATQAELHVRQPEPGAPASAPNEYSTAAPSNRQDGDLEVAVLVLGLESFFLGGVDQVDFSLTALVEQLARVHARSALQGLQDWVARSGRITPLATRIRLDDHAINLDGNAALGLNGLIDFDGSIATNDIAALVELIGVDDQRTALAITAGATLFGSRTTIGQDDATALPIRVTQGAVSIGPAQLGNLPPLRF